MSKKPSKDQLIQDLTTDLQRVQAEFINFKTRTEQLTNSESTTKKISSNK